MMAQYQNDFLFEEANVYGLDTISWSFNQDSLVIKERFYSYDPPFTRDITCLVYNCKDDHMDGKTTYIHNEWQADEETVLHYLNAPVFHLNLKKEWFDMIAEGKKKEEYRDVKPFWNDRFSNGEVHIKGKWYHATDIMICFSNGYSTNRRQMNFECDGIRKKEGGNPLWGANPLKPYWCISIGEMISKNF
jgi:hypothetical protein